MHIEYKDSDNITVTMTADELIILRYTLNEGRHKLEQTASYLRLMKEKEAKNATKTARDAKDCEEALEKAVEQIKQPSLRGRGKDKK